jgi:hypothetical protein
VRETPLLFIPQLLGELRRLEVVLLTLAVALLQ